MRDVRGNDMSMNFQEPMTSLNQLRWMGKQNSVAFFLHQGMLMA